VRRFFVFQNTTVAISPHPTRQYRAATLTKRHHQAVGFIKNARIEYHMFHASRHAPQTHPWLVNGSEAENSEGRTVHATNVRQLEYMQICMCGWTSSGHVVRTDQLVHAFCSKALAGGACRLLT
jgi:hypothetical protein